MDKSLPNHVAIIMDGNGRWAQKRGLPRALGHRRGVEALRGAVENAAALGIGYLTVYGFSTENWKRSAEEVSDLMGLLRFYLMNEMKTLHGEGARLRVIGDRENLPDDIVRLIDRAEELTVHNDRIAVTIALSYGSHSEIVSATKALAMKVAAGEMSVDDIDEVSFAGELMTYDLPPLDLLIRTSGEIRLSNFLLWQAAYSELVFVDTLWPDFDKATFKEALAEYAGRQRRFGATQPMDAAL